VIRYALRSLRRPGQRTPLAVACVAFGVMATAVRPAVLLRSAEAPRSPAQRAATALCAGLTYTAMAGVILESALAGAAVVAAAVVGIGALGAALTFISAHIARLPLPGPRVLALARRGLRREPRRSALALVALCAGTCCIAISGSAILSASDRTQARLGSATGYNLLIQAAPGDEARVGAALAAKGLTEVRAAVSYPGLVRAKGIAVEELRVVEARPAAEAAWDLMLTAGAWTGEADAALVPDSYWQGDRGWAVADRIEVAVGAGPPRELRIAGFYVPAEVGALGGTWETLVVAREATPETAEGVLRVVVAAPVGELEAAVRSLGAALPDALVMSAADLIAVQGQSYRDLFSFVAAVAGLALAAAVTLIANTVSLSLMQRAREIAILKAVGFSRGGVLGLVILEHGLVGLVGGAAGVAGAWAVLAAVNRLRPEAQLSLAPPVTLAMLGVAVVLAGVAAAAAAMRPASLRPLTLLREE
jgi:putative ABC transport system permease protein